MKLLLDTHLLLWLTGRPDRLSAGARRAIDDPDNELHFSVASLWELTIKHCLGRAEFDVEPSMLRQALRDGGCQELQVNAFHAIAVGALPPLHKDPFDRMLVAQATVEGITLLTADRRIAAHPAPVRRV